MSPAVAGAAQPPPERVDYRQLGTLDARIDGWFDEERNEIVPGVPVGPDDVVLDAGTGDGTIAAFCAHRGVHLIVTDVNEARLNQAAARLAALPARRLDVHLTAGDPLPLPDGIATRIICNQVLEHVDDPPAFMAELARVGAPGARYVLTVPGEAQEHVQRVVGIPAYFEKPHHIHIFDAARFRALVEGAGLVVERTAADGFYWSLHFAFCIQTGAFFDPDPALDAWASTWSQLLALPDGVALKHVLDAVLPKQAIIVARKPD